MTPTAAEFARFLAAAYTDWPMDDPATVWLPCSACRGQRLCQPVLCLVPPQPGDGRVVTRLRFLCRPCTKGVPGG